MAADLPIPDYDQVPLSQLQSRLRTLPIEQLEQVLDYERDHADRTAVLLTGETRLAELRTGAEPSGGSPEGVVPGGPTPASDVPSVSPQTAGPKQNPPSQGVPSNPAQPR